MVLNILILILIISWIILVVLNTHSYAIHALLLIAFILVMIKIFNKG